MSYHELFATLVALTAFAAFINDYYLKLPKTIALTIISILIAIGVSFISRSLPNYVGPIYTLVKSVDFKYTVLDVMLGYLLFASGLHVNTVELKKEIIPVIYLASVGVILATFITGYALYYVAELIKIPFSLGECLIFGALISPTDVIAVIGTFKALPSTPRRVRVLITGEGLFNDAAAILMLVILSEVVYQNIHLTFWHIAHSLVFEAGGGIAWGIIVGLSTGYILKRVRSPEVATLITIASSSWGYIVANEVHLSGALTMVVAGLIIGGFGKRNHFAKETTLVINNFWELIDEILNAFLFVLIGLAMINIQIDKSALALGAIGIVIVFAARFSSVWFPDWLLSKVLRRKSIFSINKSTLMAWGGIRGGLSIALALSIEKFPDDLVAITYVVVLGSILLQGSTFKWAIGKLGAKT